MQVFYEDILSQFGNVYVPISCHAAEDVGEPYIAKPHWHDYIEVVYTVSGESVVNIGGNVRRIVSGDLVIVNSKETHSFKSLGANRLFQIVLKFDPKILYVLGDSSIEYKYVYPLLLSKNECRRIFTNDIVADSDIPQVMGCLLKDFTEKPYAYEISIHMNTLKVFLWFLYEWKKEDAFIFSVNRLSAIRKFGNILNHILHHMDENITTESAAKMCNMNYGYFCRSFKETTGKTFTEYLNSIKISRAQQLLVTTNLNITQISAEVGFSDVNYFTRKFKEITHTQPLKFRKSFK